MKPLLLLLTFALSLSTSSASDLSKKAETALKKGVSYFHSINSNGGYVYYVTPDLSLRWGESPADEQTIEVQPPGTPAVGLAFLKAYQVTGDSKALEAAKEAAYALIRGQNKHGGWDHTINFADLTNETVSFDDDQTQTAVSFLMALDQEIDDPKLDQAVKKALDMMIMTQLDNGGWPHKWPEQGNYHDYATFNDEGINDCLRVMMEAYQYYGDNEAVAKSLKKAARFMMISQQPPPQPGWAQQYNEFLQPAWARTFEPASLCPSVTIKNIHSLVDLYLVLGDGTLLEPIPDALRWLNDIQLENGKWARFVEIGTNKSLYYDRGRIRVESVDDLHVERRTGYGYETDISAQIERGTKRYNMAMELSREDLMKAEDPPLTKAKVSERLAELEGQVAEILETQDKNGAWVTKNDRFKRTMPRGVRWNGEYDEMDRVSSAVFNQNVAILSEYIELSKVLK
ncbi:MAG: pectate lyase [Cyclobacteriaceae bacterium]